MRGLRGASSCTSLPPMMETTKFVYALALASLVAPSGCGGKVVVDGVEGPSGGDGTIAAECFAICQSESISSCIPQEDCVSRCVDVYDATPEGCKAVHKALLDCILLHAHEASFCDGLNKACGAEETADEICVKTGG